LKCCLRFRKFAFELSNGVFKSLDAVLALEHLPVRITEFAFELRSHGSIP
jgi:hypothetical protein